MVTAEGVLDQARNWIGYVEEPDGDTPFSRQWGYSGGAWCGMFCQSMVVAAGGTVGDGNTTIPFTHYTVTGVEAFMGRGAWSGEPAPGRLIYFRWGDYGDPVHHVGLVESWDGGDEIVTIEGNINNSVVNTSRYLSSGTVVGFGVPAYSATPTPPPAEPPTQLSTTTIEDEAMNVYVGGNGAGRWFLQAGGNLVPVSKGDVVLKQRPAVNVIYCSDEFIKRLAKALPVIQ